MLPRIIVAYFVSQHRVSHKLLIFIPPEVDVSQAYHYAEQKVEEFMTQTTAYLGYEISYGPLEWSNGMCFV